MASSTPLTTKPPTRTAAGRRDPEATAAGQLIKPTADKEVEAFRNYVDSQFHERVAK